MSYTMWFNFSYDPSAQESFPCDERGRVALGSLDYNDRCRYARCVGREAEGKATRHSDAPLRSYDRPLCELAKWKSK